MSSSPVSSQRLQAGEDHRPAAVELVVRALAQLVVGDGQPARVADRLDLPRDPRGALAPSRRRPRARRMRLHEPARRVDLEVLALAEQAAAPGCAHLVARAGRPVRRRRRRRSCTCSRISGSVIASQRRSGRRADVDLEHLLHRCSPVSVLRSLSAGGPGLGVLAHPPVVDEPDRDGVQEVELLAAAPPGDDEAGLLEQLAGASSRRSASSGSAPRARSASARPRGTARRAGSAGSDRRGP